MVIDLDRHDLERLFNGEIVMMQVGDNRTGLLFDEDLIKDCVLHYKGYSAKPEYSVSDKIFHGKVLGITDLVYFCAENAKDVEQEFHKAVDDYLEFCKEIGKDPRKSKIDP